MKKGYDHFTKHARKRLQQRSIPPGIVSLIMEFGAEARAGDGATSYFLTKDSCREIKRWFGGGFADAIGRYRRAYVIADGETVITAAFGSRPRFN